MKAGFLISIFLLQEALICGQIQCFGSCNKDTLNLACPVTTVASCCDPSCGGTTYVDPSTGNCLPCPTTKEVKCYTACGCDESSFTCVTRVEKCCHPNGCGGTYYKDPTTEKCVPCPAGLLTAQDVKCHKTCIGNTICSGTSLDKCCLPVSQGGCGGTNTLDITTNQCFPCPQPPSPPIFCPPSPVNTTAPPSVNPLVPKPAAPAPKPAAPAPKPAAPAPKPADPAPKPADPAPKPSAPAPKPAAPAPKPAAPAPKPAAPAPKPDVSVKCFGSCNEDTLNLACPNTTVARCCDPGCGGTTYVDPRTRNCLPCPTTREVQCYTACGCDESSFTFVAIVEKCCSPNVGAYYKDPTTEKCVPCPAGLFTAQVQCHKTCIGNTICSAASLDRCCLPVSQGGCGGTNVLDITTNQCIPCPQPPSPPIFCPPSPVSVNPLVAKPAAPAPKPAAPAPKPAAPAPKPANPAPKPAAPAPKPAAPAPKPEAPAPKPAAPAPKPKDPAPKPAAPAPKPAAPAPKPTVPAPKLVAPRPKPGALVLLLPNDAS